jgi:predicted DNA-binding protein
MKRFTKQKTYRIDKDTEKMLKYLVEYYSSDESKILRRLIQKEYKRLKP